MLNIGDTVKIDSLNLYGKILNITTKSNSKFKKYSILVNDKILNTNENMLTKVSDENVIDNNNNKYFNPKKSQRFYSQLDSYTDIENEIMLRHQTASEALFNLENFVDYAICNKINRIKIIHGKHGGVLKNIVHEYLKHNPNVIEYHLGNYYEGQHGVTIANLNIK